MSKPNTLNEEVIALAEEIKAKYELEEERADEIAARICAVLSESDDLEEAPKILNIKPEDQLSILGTMADYGVYVDIKKTITNALRACLESPNDSVFEMLDEIAAEMCLYSGELVYYLS